MSNNVNVTTVDPNTLSLLERIAVALEKQNELNAAQLECTSLLVNLRFVEAGTLFHSMQTQAKIKLGALEKPDYPTPEEREAWKAEEKPLFEKSLEVANDAYSTILELIRPQ